MCEGAGTTGGAGGTSNLTRGSEVQGKYTDLGTLRWPGSAATAPGLWCMCKLGKEGILALEVCPYLGTQGLTFGTRASRL
jgi:hypothetical protein